MLPEIAGQQNCWMAPAWLGFAAKQKTLCRKTFIRGLYLHTGW